MTSHTYIGTSGWTYKDWKGDFYPADVPQKDQLAYIGKVFDTVEVNGSFYRFPRKENVHGWVDQTPHDFRLTFKMWRGVSHFRKLNNVDRYVHDFFDTLGVAPTKQRGAVLVQLPPNQGPDLEKLAHFLDTVKQKTKPHHWRVALEVRNDKWLDGATREDLDAVLDDHSAGLVVHDIAKGRTDDPNEGPAFVYVRRHGPGGDVTKRYKRSAIERDAKRFRDWNQNGRMVFVYYNNDVGGHAPHNAQELQDALGQHT